MTHKVRHTNVGNCYMLVDEAIKTAGGKTIKPHVYLNVLKLRSCQSENIS